MGISLTSPHLQCDESGIGTFANCVKLEEEAPLISEKRIFVPPKKKGKQLKYYDASSRKLPFPLALLNEHFCQLSHMQATQAIGSIRFQVKSGVGAIAAQIKRPDYPSWTCHWLLWERLGKRHHYSYLNFHPTNGYWNPGKH
ncbi:hypothetical protein CEXT_128071 [Caerostris extrusa]|uniref:Uncharacterized protein n=1 Tax=Caerostris extrusa TaxID=172846 RepID=A0AAV4P3A7_CAEEX|nr:hypothetical protein CEXT_128071 [Caerostris extrusa]